MGAATPGKRARVGHNGSFSRGRTRLSPYDRDLRTAELRIGLLATGRFISICPYSAYSLSTRRPELQVLAVRQSLGHAPVGIVILKNRTISTLAQLFINHCRELAKQLARRIR